MASIEATTTKGALAARERNPNMEHPRSRGGEVTRGEILQSISEQPELVELVEGVDAAAIDHAHRAAVAGRAAAATDGERDRAALAVAAGG